MKVRLGLDYDGHLIHIGILKHLRDTDPFRMPEGFEHGATPPDLSEEQYDARVEAIIAQCPNLISDITELAQCEDISEIELFLFSSRADKDKDDFNRIKRVERSLVDTGSCFFLMQALHRKLVVMFGDKITFDNALLVDAINALPAGTSFQRITDSSAETHHDCKVDEQKIIMTYHALHRAAEKGQSYVVLSDDMENIVEVLVEYFTKNACLIPNSIQLIVIHNAPDTGTHTKYEPITGQGDFDRYYARTTKTWLDALSHPDEFVVKNVHATPVKRIINEFRAEPAVSIGRSTLTMYGSSLGRDAKQEAAEAAPTLGS